MPAQQVALIRPCPVVCFGIPTAYCSGLKNTGLAQMPEEDVHHLLLRLLGLVLQQHREVCAQSRSCSVHGSVVGLSTGSWYLRPPLGGHGWQIAGRSSQIQVARPLHSA